MLVLGIIYEQRREDVALVQKIKMLGIGSFVLFFGFRGYIWHDWTSYYVFYEDSTWADFLDYDYFTNREPGWLFLVLLSKSLGLTYPIFSFGLTVLSLYLLTRFLRRYTDNILLALALYLAFRGFVISINLLRNSLSILIFLNSLELIREKAFLKYLGSCLLGMSIHLSSIVFIPLYFILNLKINRWVFLIIIFSCLASLGIGFSPFVEIVTLLFEDNAMALQRLETYIGFGQHSIPKSVILERSFTCFLIFMYYEVLVERKETNRIFINSFLCYIIGTTLTNDISEVSNRIGIMFIYPYWILWLELVFCMRYYGNRCLFGGAAILYIVYSLFFAISTPVMEYRNYLLGNAKSYQESLDYFNKTFKEPDQ